MTRVTFEPATARPPLPGGPVLHRMVRASTPRKGGEPPAAFTWSRERAEALDVAQRELRDGMRELIRTAYERGVPVSTLARWSGYTPRWVSVIVAGEERAS